MCLHMRHVHRVQRDARRVHCELYAHRTRKCVCVCVHTGALLSAWLLWARSAQHIESCDKLGQLHAYRPAVNTPL